MIRTTLSPNAFEEMEICLRHAAERRGCSILEVYDLSARLGEAGCPVKSRIRVYELCPPQAYARLVERNPALAAVLPLRISTQAVEGGTALSVVSLERLMQVESDPELVPLLQEMQGMIEEIMDEAGRLREKRMPARPALPGAPPFEGAEEDQVSLRGQIPQRINRQGTKVEDLAGTGRHDAPGG